MFPAAILYCEIPIYAHTQNNIVSRFMGWPSWIAIIRKWVTLLTWLCQGWQKKVSPCPCNQKSHKWNFSFFSIFHLFQKVILHKMLKLGFWNFYWLHFFLKLTFVCLSWYLHLNPSSANPTKWSNFYRRIVWVCLIILWGWRLKG